MPKYNKEPNLLHHYFSPDSAIYRIIEEVREGFLKNELRRFNAGLIERAKSEVEIKRSALDSSTYLFAQDLNHYLCRGAKRRVATLVEGVFHGKDSLDSIFLIDLGRSEE